MISPITRAPASLVKRSTTHVRLTRCAAIPRCEAQRAARGIAYATLPRPTMAAMSGGTSPYASAAERRPAFALSCVRNPRA